MRIASGETFDDLDMRQDDIYVRGAALQCRITTEDPANGFRPDAGQITVYRSAGGGGVRLDGGTVFVGAQVSPHFDSMLVKLTCRGRTFPMAVRRARRALAEFRIRGVSTNIPFLEAVLADPVFQRGEATTSFIDERPELLEARMGGDRGTKLLTYLADVTVNQPHGPATSSSSRAPSCPTIDRDAPGAPRLPRPAGAGRPGRVRPAAARAHRRAGHRHHLPRRPPEPAGHPDAHPRPAARRRARLPAHPELLSMEAWGGATYDVALRFLSEDPWERLALLREAMPNIPLQMLLRGRNTVGYTPYPTKVTDAFVHEAARTGLDIFRIFDSLNDVAQMRPAVEAVLDTGTAVAEVALCYTGNLLDPREKLYTLDYYLRLAEQIVDTGAHVLAIKDMAGLLRAPAATQLVTALRENFDLPVHLHTHDTAGGQIGTLLAAIDAGVDAVDAACSSMSGTTSQPSLSALVAATDGTERPNRPGHRQGLLARALLGGRAPLYRPSSRGWPPPPAGSTSTRSPVASCRTCASRRSPSASATGSRTSRTCTPRPTASSATWSRSPPRRRWSATSPCPRRRRRRPGRLRGEPARSTTSPTRSSASSRASWATRPAAGPSRSAPRPCRAATPSRAPPS